MSAADANVRIYRLDRHEPEKQARARDLLADLGGDPAPTVLPWQVLGELIGQLRFWRDPGPGL